MPVPLADIADTPRCVVAGARIVPQLPENGRAADGTAFGTRPALVLAIWRPCRALKTSERMEAPVTGLGVHHSVPPVTCACRVMIAEGAELLHCPFHERSDRLQLADHASSVVFVKAFA